jgi:DNA polymerase III delta subunit
VEIREAHKIQDLDALDPLLKQAHTTPRSRSETPWVLVLISDALDGRKKSTKTLTQVSAYLPCDPVAEQDRGAWVKYLAKSLTPELSLKLRPEWVEALTYLDPWTLDRVSLELKKLDLVRDSDEDLASLISEGVLGGENEQFFLDAFLSKQKNLALRSLPSFCEEPEKVHPLMGLLGWNIRNLALILACREGRISTTELKLGPWILRRLESYAPRWTLRELSGVARHLSQMDFALKQTQTSGVTLWTDLVLTIS